MNKIFLFLYPINEYISHLLYCNSKKANEDKVMMNRFNEIIDKKYRQAGWQVVWLLFSRCGNPEQPELGLLHEKIKIAANDLIIPSGKNILEMKQKIYPDPEKILSRWSAENTILRLGGFHQNDCVEKIAEFAYWQKRNVLVDEQTTETFFNAWRLGVKTSTTQSGEFLANLFNAKRCGSLYQEICEQRAKRPWLEKIQ